MNLKPIPNEPGLFTRDMHPQDEDDLFESKLIFAKLKNPHGYPVMIMPAVVIKTSHKTMTQTVKLVVDQIKENTRDIGGYDLTWDGSGMVEAFQFIRVGKDRTPSMGYIDIPYTQARLL